ncbi:hypothetical protein E2562_001825 [Oryza meyeriana var. granulata]|uniref:USP domain-containing protein n=1 Tax=Oryza meyeriana var. granulata TaxID=110450 RepID=A0A6G1CDQ2_9ORYZ|nr:hypothetical protein E2562_001825 [Oryza meyeriana var. granulata]
MPRSRLCRLRALPFASSDAMEEEKRARAGDRATAESPRKGKPGGLSRRLLYWRLLILDAAALRRWRRAVQGVLRASDVMEEEKSAMARETAKWSPRNLELPDVAAPESGCGDTTPLPEQKAAAAAPTSNTEGRICAHLDRFQGGMLKFISEIRSSECAPRCEHYLCENKVEKSSILVCIDCNLHFCIGDGTKNKPQGHARWHADLEQHCVGALFSEPENLYCFLCERLLYLDVSNMQRGHFSCDKEEINSCSHQCNWYFCIGGPDNKARPQGHIREHALLEEHWVAVWYNDPYVGYCFACEGLEDMVMMKTSHPLKVDSIEVEQSSQRKDGLHVPSQTQMDKVPGEIVQVPTEAGDSGQNDNAGLDNTSSEPKVSIEAKKNTCSVEGAAEDKGRAQCSNIAYGKAEDNNSLASIEECLAVHFKPELLEWTCENCSKVAHRPSTTSSKDGEQMMASTKENIIIDGYQTEQSDKIACQSEQSSNLDSLALECTSSRQPHGSDSQRQAMLTVDSITEGISTSPPVKHMYALRSRGPPPKQDLASDNIGNKKTEVHEGVQEAVPSSLPAKEPANQLSGQGQNSSTLEQGIDHSSEDRNQGAIQSRLISKLPPVLAIHLKRSLLTGKVRGHVSFEEILDVGQFMDPSSEDKENSSYRLVGVIEHLGPSTSSGHWIAYVRPSQEQPDGGSSSWYCASDTNVREVSLEEVLKCEAHLLFYERIEG